MAQLLLSCPKLRRSALHTKSPRTKVTKSHSSTFYRRSRPVRGAHKATIRHQASATRSSSTGATVTPPQSRLVYCTTEIAAPQTRAQAAAAAAGAVNAWVHAAAAVAGARQTAAAAPALKQRLIPSSSTAAQGDTSNTSIHHRQPHQHQQHIAEQQQHQHQHPQRQQHWQQQEHQQPQPCSIPSLVLRVVVFINSCCFNLQLPHDCSIGWLRQQVAEKLGGQVSTDTLQLSYAGKPLNALPDKQQFIALPGIRQLHVLMRLYGG